MDANQLRLALLLAGMVLVAAIYFWDRYKRSRARLKGLRPGRAQKMRQEYGSDQHDENVPSFSAVMPEEKATKPLVSKKKKKETMVPVPEQTELDLGFDESSSPLDELPEDAPRLVVQIGLKRRDDTPFIGPEVATALVAAGLQPGAMKIYHRHDPRHPDQVLFSVANMVEPGHFPLDDMEEFTTPGLLFFAQLPGVRDGLEIYSEMLFAANEVATLLDGVLLDENRAVLTKQSIQLTKDRIAEHRRQLRLGHKTQQG